VNTSFTAAALAALALCNMAFATGQNQPMPASCPGGGGSSVLHDQLPGASPFAINSQNYGSPTDDNAAADDFVVPAGWTWKIKRVVVKGDYFSGAVPPSPPADVTFYKDAGGVPGTVQCSYPAATSLPWGIQPNGNMEVQNLNCTLPAGHYFVSFVANMGFGSGQWGWRLQPTQNFWPAVWENPGGGFGNCTSWGDLASCLGQASPDLAFRLIGCAY